MIEESKLPIHQGYCYRNFRKCDKCDEIIDINTKQDHFDEFHKQVKCEQCGGEFEVKKLEAHKPNCPMRKQICQYCNLEVLVREIATHTSHCGSRTKNCQFCNKIYTLKEIDVHESGCLDEQRREKERIAALAIQRNKAEELKRKEEMLRQQELENRERLRRQEMERKAEEERKALQLRKEQEWRRAEELKRAEDAKRAADARNYQPKTTYQTTHEASARIGAAGGSSGTNTQTGAYRGAGPASVSYSGATGLQAKGTSIPKPTQGTSVYTKPGTSSIPTGPNPYSYNPAPSSNIGSTGSRAQPQQSSYQSKPSNQYSRGYEDDSEVLARQLQAEYDRQANEDYMRKNKPPTAYDDDERLARAYQEQLDRELAQKLQQEGASPTDSPDYPRGAGFGGMGGGFRGGFEPDEVDRIMSQGGFPSGMGGLPRGAGAGVGARPTPGSSAGSRGTGAGYGAAGPQNYGREASGANTYAGGYGASAGNDEEEDEEYQRTLLESLKSRAQPGAGRYGR